MHPVTHQRNTFSVGLMIALASWGIVFFTLMWGYIVYHMRASIWLEGLTIPVVTMALANTCILIASSILLHGRKQWQWIGAMVLGMFFLLCQWHLWKVVLSSGLSWQSSVAGSFFYLLTGFHAIHIVGGLIAISVGCFKKHYSQESSSFEIAVRRIWDFLLVIWIVFFALIFIVK